MHFSKNYLKKICAQANFYLMRVNGGAAGAFTMHINANMIIYIDS